ncbi:MAG: BTAD domain-containing putative transcriptional regulator [Candidatus Thiodiazotropha sp.]
MELSLFGGFQLIDDTGAAVELKARKTKALLAWLALHQEKPQPRERLALLLWEESSEAQARHSLRQALSGLRKVMGGHAHALVADQASVLLRRGHVVTDCGSFDSLLKQAQTPEHMTRLVSLYGGEFLEGFNPRADNYEEWLITQRSHYRELAINTMSKLMAHYVETAQLEKGIRLAIKLLASDPLQEEFHRNLMRLYARLNRPADALRQYRKCRRLLMRELGLSPEPETERLHKEILRQRSGEAGNSGAVDTGRTATPQPRSTQASSTPSDQPQQNLRTVTVAHLHLGHYLSLVSSQDPESMHALMRQLLELLNRHITHYGGTLHHQHGEAIAILFGVEKAYGNECDKALQLLLELCGDSEAVSTDLTRLGVGCGIATGRVVSDGRSVVSGAVFAQAEQLARSAAPGEILLSNPAYLGLRMEIAATQNGDSNWKISTTPPDTPRHDTPLPFVGRSRELRQLTTALEACIEDRAGETYLLRGESGIGKTRLVGEISQHALQMGVTPHRALVLDFGMESATAPIPSLLRQLIGLDNSATAEGIELILQPLLGDGWNPALHPVALRQLFRLPVAAESMPLLDSLSEEVQHLGVVQIIQAILASITATAPRLLIVEDIHWADPSTLSHLAELADVVSRYSSLLIITSRVEGEPLDPAWRSSMHGAPLTTLDLQPLPREQAERLAQRISDHDQAFVDRCIERSGGNPFFLEQLLLGAAEREGKVPDSIQSLVLSRLDLLADEDRLAVQAASVLGQRFGLDPLEQLLGSSDYRPDALLNLRLLQPEGEGYLFVHALLRDAIYESLLPSQRRALHLRAAAWYQHRDPALHAQHLDLGGNQDAAEAYLQAAQQAVALADFTRALSLASRGAEIAPPGNLGAQLNCLQGDLLIQGGAIAAAIQAFAAAADKAGDDNTRCRAMIGEATGLTVQDDLDQALAILDKAAPIARQGPDGALLTELHYRRGDILFALARTDECLQAHSEAETLARQSDNPLLEIRALAGMADAYYAKGQIVTAQGYFERCLALAKQAHRLPQEVGNLSMYGVTHLYTGSISKALETLHDAAKLAAEYGNLRAEMAAYMNLGLVYLFTDDYDAAERFGHRGLELARQLRASRFYGDNLAEIGEAVALKGDIETAVDYLQRAHQAALDSVPTHITPYILGVLARVTTDEKQRQDAIREAERYLESGSLSHNHLHFYQNMMDVYVRCRDAEKILYYADALAEYTRSEPLSWSDFYIERGRLLARYIRDENVLELAPMAKQLLDEAARAGLHAGTLELREIAAVAGEQATR